jgi:nicotinate-nucleotide adenylyltransferase
MGVSEKSGPPQRIGVLGGAFDPPHVVHVALAEAACAQLQLDALHVIPTGDAWHKTRTLTAAEHRIAMTRLAFAHIPQAVVDTREIARSGPTYTVDTLRELRAEYPDAQLYLIMGADQARLARMGRGRPACYNLCSCSRTIGGRKRCYSY